MVVGERKGWRCVSNVVIAPPRITDSRRVEKFNVPVKNGVVVPQSSVDSVRESEIHAMGKSG
eukprot:7574319-Lingulodinium_polyedra.AAC.1